MDIQNSKNQPDTEKFTAIGKWARRCFADRTVPFTAGFLVFIACFSMVFTSVYCFWKHKLIIGSMMVGLFVITFIYQLQRNTTQTKTDDTNKEQ